MNWGVLPVLYTGESTDEGKIAFGISQGRRRGILNSGDIAIATSGQSQATGGTNLIRVLTVY
jgi:pyruvate kinase